jgi:hypothetical protein
MTILFYLLGGLVFMFIQSLFINGMYELFQGKCVQDMNKGRICDGNLMYKISPEFFERNKNKVWFRPLGSCVKCMSSLYSILTFWPLVLYVFGFHWIEIYAWVLDSVALISLNYWVFKKL